MFMFQDDLITHSRLLINSCFNINSHQNLGKNIPSSGIEESTNELFWNKLEQESH